MQRVRVVKDLPKLMLVGRKVGPVASGQEIDVWTWEAPVLERHGFVERIWKPTVAELRKLVLAEEKSPTLRELPLDFYLTIAGEVTRARESGEIEHLEELLDATDSLVETRVQKIVNLAVSGVKVKGLPPEEQFLLNRLTLVLNSWREWLGRFLGKRTEEAGENGEKFRKPV